MKHLLRVQPSEYTQIVELLRENLRIQAIKTTRLASDCGLREAKMAVERLCEEHSGLQSRGRVIPEEAPYIVTHPKIVEVTLDYGVGPIKMDLETMQMTVLTQLHSIGIDAVGDALEVVDILTALNEGRRVQVLDETR